ncbi:MAG TPA: hypothetical protein VJZ76_10065 [Thermoanaerobaculia bacterium]|nr:hypothetical protein [Thermoanaerobaculia bacterium]
MRRSLTLLAIALLAAGCHRTTDAFTAAAQREYRSARVAAFFHRGSADAQIRLGRAQLRMWRPEEAQASFLRAGKLDEKCAPRIAAAYIGVARELAKLSRDAVATNPLVAKYAGLADVYDPSTNARLWLFPEVARRLPSFDTEQAVQIFRRTDSQFDPRQGRTLLRVMQEEMMEIGSDPERLLPYYDVAYEVRDKNNHDDRDWLARGYAFLAKKLPESNADDIRRSIERAMENDARFNDDPELLAIRVRLGDVEAKPLTKMARTASLLFNIARAASAYYKEHQEFPPCPSIDSFVGDLRGYSQEPLSTTDEWGGELRCTGMQHQLWFRVESAGPDREHSRGETLTAYEAMHRQDDDSPADIYIEAGFYAPPWWSKENVRRLYGAN